MENADRIEFEAFVDDLTGAYQRVGGGRLALDAARLMTLVSGNRSGARRFVELSCELAQAQPGYLQQAILVAAAYDQAFGLAELVPRVARRVEELGPLAAEAIRDVAIGEFSEGASGLGTDEGPASVREAPLPDDSRRQYPVVPGETNPAVVFRQFLSGDISLESVAAWVEDARPRFQRPESAQDNDAGMDAELSQYVWEVNQRALGKMLQRVADFTCQKVDAEPDKAALYAQGLLLAATMLSRDEIVGKLAAQVGVILAVTGQKELAADAFVDSVTALGRWGEDLALMADAGGSLCGLLLDVQDFDRAINAGQLLQEVAAAAKLRGYQVMALFTLGSANAELGRTEGLEQLRVAVDMRRQLPDEEAAEQQVTPLSSYLGAYGVKARDAGQLEAALEAFTEMAHVTAERADRKMHAYALSEIGHTFMAAGNPTLAADYLLQAAAAGDKHGVDDGPARWRALAIVLQGQGSAPVPAETPNAGSPAPVPDHLRVPQLINAGDYKAALALARQVSASALAAESTEIAIESFNNIGICERNLGHFEESVRSFQRGIQLADGRRHHRASVDLRRNLAEAYIERQMYHEALPVVLAAIGFAHMLWDANAVTGLREQIIASTSSLYDRGALIAMYYSHCFTLSGFMMPAA